MRNRNAVARSLSPAAQRLGGRPHVMPGSMREHIIALLSDGKPRTPQQILDEGRARGWATAATTKRSIYENLFLYIEQEAAANHKAMVVEDPATRRFRINYPVDDWPEIVLAPRPRYLDPSTFEAMAKRLRETSVGADATAFELAVCDAFAIMGFVTQHLGGHHQPDGILDAPLGPLAYRATLECKSTPHTETVSQPRIEEIVKFREPMRADFSVLVGPQFHVGESFAQETQLHKVSVWTVEDVITALRIDVDAYECRDLFVPGFINERLGDLEWNRSHGAEKRAAVIRKLLRSEGYAAQSSIAGHVAPSDAPVLSLDAATLLVETALRRAGASAVATREEVRAAMDDLTRAGEAVRLPDREGIVIRRSDSRPGNVTL